jgi:imidazolonepropionase-like amidohydrolase
MSRLAALLAEPAPARGRLWLTNARLFDGSGAAVVEDAAVLVDDGSVASIGRAGDAVPDGAIVVDLGGRTLLPGLIDAHAHVYANMPGQAEGPSRAVPGSPRTSSPRTCVRRCGWVSPRFASGLLRR